MSQLRGVPDRIISGGQTGADRGGLDAAIELGIQHGGACPRGRRSEDGAIPAKYQLYELPGSSYRERTSENVSNADAVVIFYGAELGPGSNLTLNIARIRSKELHLVPIERVTQEEAACGLREFLERVRPKTLMIAGSRESGRPGMAEWVRSVVKSALS